MLTTSLIMIIIISSKTFIECFRMLNTKLLGQQFIKSNLNVKLISSAFDDDSDNNDRRKKKLDYNYYSDSNSISASDFNYNREEQFILSNNEKINNNYDNLYTLIWYDCEDCRKLFGDVKNICNKISYIDGSYYFFDENDETNEPLFYKNDKLIATDIFSIYEELFYSKIIKE